MIDKEVKKGEMRERRARERGEKGREERKRERRERERGEKEREERERGERERERGVPSSDDMQLKRHSEIPQSNDIQRYHNQLKFNNMQVK